MSDMTEKNEHLEKNDEPKDDVEGHVLEHLEEADVEGHMFEKNAHLEKNE